MRHSTQNAILTKLLTWEYGNGVAPFSRQKSSKVSHLVHYGASTRRLCIWRVSTCLYCDEPKPFKASSMLMHAAYTEKLMSLRWHGSRQSHHDNRAHKIAWICTYHSRLERIPTLQGQEHSRLARGTRMATKVHYTMCLITHTHAGIYIYIYICICVCVCVCVHTSCIMLSHRARK